MAIEWLKQTSEFLARRKGLPVIVGAAFVLLNFVIRLLPAWPGVAWLAQIDLFLHLGVLIGLLGMLVGDAL
jgi:NhaP-type Na+/H+ and K+/H+ antiporter